MAMNIILPCMAPAFLYSSEATNMSVVCAGFVSAADDWGQPVQHKAVRPSMTGSYENLLHTALQQRSLPGCFALDLRGQELKEELHVRPAYCANSACHLLSLCDVPTCDMSH